MSSKVFVVCGPTASGKSDVADSMADSLTDFYGSYAPVLVVDSMQVYKELPVVTNQARDRKAYMTGVVSVTEEWTMAHHRSLADSLLEGTDAPTVLDAGTGMYLNAILLGIKVAPKVSEHVRKQAEDVTRGEPNHRRASRKKELELQKAPERNSIWDGDLRYETCVVYLRPERSEIRERVGARSRYIVEKGLREVQDLLHLHDYEDINSSVKDSIGFKELHSVSTGDISKEEAVARVSSRTFKLAKRQVRWFDKLARVLEPRANIEVLQDSSHLAHPHFKRCMPGTIH